MHIYPHIASNFIQARRKRETEEALEEEERANRELGAQIEADMLAKELQYKARKHTNSEATKVPASYGDVDTLTESFNEMDPRTGMSHSHSPLTSLLNLNLTSKPILASSA